MSSKWDSGIIVWRADGQMQVLKEGNDGVYVVDPKPEGLPGAVWLGLGGSAGKGEWKLRIKESGDGGDNIYSCRNQHDAKKMEKRISKHAHRRQPGEQPPAPRPPKRNVPPEPPVGYTG